MPKAEYNPDPSLTSRNWASEYQSAYLAANGHEAQVVETASGWYKIQSSDGFCTGINHRREKIIKMTERLIERARKKATA